MKAASAAMVTFLNGIRGNTDAVANRANVFQFALLSGTTLYYTDADVNFTFNGQRYSSNGVYISGLKYRGSIGLDVDTQEAVIAVDPTYTLPNGQSFMQALENGLFDGCQITRTLVWFTDKIGGTLVDNQGIVMFKGRLGKVSEVGRTTATITVNSDLSLLDIDMPRNLYQPTCLHTLYDTGCTLNKAIFSASGAVGSSSTVSVINWASASIVYRQGRILFTSGANNGLSATVKSVVAGVSMTLVYPLVYTPTPGDTFTVYQGCDHTSTTCQNKFSNMANFRGFPVVPPAQTAF